MVQSYVDVFLGGAIQIQDQMEASLEKCQAQAKADTGKAETGKAEGEGEGHKSCPSLPPNFDFALESCRSTFGWANEHWVNDRPYPTRRGGYSSEASASEKIDALLLRCAAKSGYRAAVTQFSPLTLSNIEHIPHPPEAGSGEMRSKGIHAHGANNWVLWLCLFGA